MGSIEPIEASVTVPLPLEEAYTAFVGGFGRWWPREFTWSGTDHLADTGITDDLGGTAWEVGALGVRWDFGVVLVHEPPERIAFSWQIGPDRVPVPHPDDASLVEVAFSGNEGASDGPTTVRLVHRRFEVHGDAAQTYRDQLESAWPYALDAYATATVT